MGADRDVTVAVIVHRPASAPGRGRRGGIGQRALPRRPKSRRPEKVQPFPDKGRTQAVLETRINTRPAMISAAAESRIAETCSPNTKMPTAKVPIAPIPVQIV